MRVRQHEGAVIDGGDRWTSGPAFTLALRRAEEKRKLAAKAKHKTLRAVLEVILWVGCLVAGDWIAASCNGGI